MTEFSNSKKMRRAIAVAIIVFVLGICWLWLRSASPVRRSGEVPAFSSASSAFTSLSPQISPGSAAPSQMPGGPYVSSDPRWAIVREKDKVDKSWEWKMPINFYGRVVDENNRPISGAHVAFLWTSLSSEGSSRSATESDGSGVFVLEGRTGRVLQVDVSKEGFYKLRSERLKSFDYAAFWESNYYKPDPAQPIIFHLRRKGTGEALTTGEIQPAVSADGTPVRLDLLNKGYASANGQVQIAAITNTEKYPPRRFDWQASITIEDGGLVEHDSEFPFEAPIDGYESTIAFQMTADSPAWKRSVEKSYFIRFGNPPKYGRIFIRLNGASQKASLRYAINPTGSRNLERPTDEQFSEP